MIDGISIIMPCDKFRLSLLLMTFARYIKFTIPENVEFLIVSRTIDKIEIPGINIRVIKYDWKKDFFNPSLAFNLGVKKAKYDNIIITSPEVTPVSNVLYQFGNKPRGNYVCLTYEDRKSVV